MTTNTEKKSDLDKRKNDEKCTGANRGIEKEIEKSKRPQMTVMQSDLLNKSNLPNKRQFKENK